MRARYVSALIAGCRAGRPKSGRSISSRPTLIAVRADILPPIGLLANGLLLHPAEGDRVPSQVAGQNGRRPARLQRPHDLRDLELERPDGIAVSHLRLEDAVLVVIDR